MEASAKTQDDSVIVKLYRVSHTVVMRPGFSRVPCGVCSVSIYYVPISVLLGSWWLTMAWWVGPQSHTVFHQFCVPR